MNTAPDVPPVLMNYTAIVTKNPNSDFTLAVQSLVETFKADTDIDRLDMSEALKFIAGCEERAATRGLKTTCSGSEDGLPARRGFKL